MSKLLAWDTSQKTGVIVAVELIQGSPGDYKIASQWTMNVEAFHSEKLLWAIDKTLESCGWSIHQVDAFGVGLGPGSFTGLRIGLTTARTMAHSLGKPLIGFSSLSGFAYESLCVLEGAGLSKKTLAITGIEGAKGQIFIQCGRADLCEKYFIPSQGEVEECAIEPENLDKFLSSYKKKHKRTVLKSKVFLGPAFKEKSKSSKLPFFLSENVSPRAIAFFVSQGFIHKKYTNPLEITPRYLRASYAEVQREKMG